MSWNELEFRDFIKLQRGFDLPRLKMKGGNVPVLGSNCIIGYHNEAKVQPPGVVTGRSGTLGLVQYTEEPYWPHNTALWVKDYKGNEPMFVYYKLKTLTLERFTSGTSVPTLNRNNLDNLSLKIPDTQIQKRISEKLSVYDELIENNLRRIELLEESARMLYREWFVHLRFPGHEHTKITNSVPEGWGKKSFDEIAEFVNGYAFKPSDWFDSGLPIIKIVELKNGVTEKTPRNSGDLIPSKYHVDNGCILFSWSADLGVYFWCEGKGLLNQHLFNVLPRNPINKLFILLSIYHCIPKFKSKTTGATMRHIRRSALSEVQMILPDHKLIDYFNSLVEPIYKQILNCKLQNLALRNARDILLPRLLNGVIVV